MPDLRSPGGVEQYNGQPVHTQPNGDMCDQGQRQYIQPQYASSPVQGATYPRFPPYDRLEIRPITSSPNSPSPTSQYYGNPCNQAPPGPPLPQPAHQPPQHAPMNHPNAYVPQDGQNNCRGSPHHDPNGAQHPNMSPAQYPSCKMQPQPVPHGPPHQQQAMGHDPNGVVHRQVNSECGPPPPPPPNTMPPCQSPVQSPQQPPPQMYQNHGGPPPNQQQVQQQQQVQPPQAGNMPSPLYPWMRSQFGLDDCEDDCERKCGGDLQEEYDALSPYETPPPPMPPVQPPLCQEGTDGPLYPKQNERPEIVHNPLLLAGYKRVSPVFSAFEDNGGNVMDYPIFIPPTFLTKLYYVKGITPVVV
ncbi:homeotic protein antennapedia [Trichonephila inaurata madagascariensis]|uniref:Homeotic protein antennapedia n=1 Tax=Trichonephila inaurata madagascariensis TaxID=2747483 RepID=A0A8X7BRG4_9ARAC|nr:homeotic protein antennapedia [Trichonephila inaurata madagascariensis]